MFKYFVYLYKAVHFWIKRKIHTLDESLNHQESGFDERDRIYGATSVVNPNAVIDFSPQLGEVYDQLGVNSCTANAIAALYFYTTRKEYKKDFVPSRLGLYYDQRVFGGNVDKDNGSNYRMSFKVCTKIGLYPESMWPYDPKKVFTKPPANCYKEAVKHQTLVYEAVPQKLESVCNALNYGYPVAFGFKVYTSFLSASTAATGIVNVPFPSDKECGSHAAVIVGYNAKKRTFLVRNSWGKTWGQKGHFTMPFDYVLHPKLANDLFIMKKVEG